VLALAVRRGSTTICLAPRARPSSKYCIAGGSVSAGLLPTSRMTSACATSANGKGSPRSIPNERFDAAAADDMQKAAVVIDRRGTQCYTREFAELVGLLIGQAATAKASHASRP